MLSWINDEYLKIKYPVYARASSILALLLPYVEKNVAGIIIEQTLGHGGMCVNQMRPDICNLCMGHTAECDELRKNDKCCYCSLHMARSVKWCDACPVICLVYWVSEGNECRNIRIKKYYRKDCGDCIKAKNRDD